MVYYAKVLSKYYLMRVSNGLCGGVRWTVNGSMPAWVTSAVRSR